jgi:hypothetical protein
MRPTEIIRLTTFHSVPFFSTALMADEAAGTLFEVTRSAFV